MAHLLQQGGFTEAAILTAMDGGLNNRVYHVQEGERSAVLKAYFQHKQDTRDRLHHEYSWLSFLWQHGVTNVPRPIAQDTHERQALYEYVEGRAATISDITQYTINQCVAFVIAVNHHRDHAAHLPTASEACMTTSEHLQLVEKRVQRLQQIQPDTPIHEQVRAFVSERLRPRWEAVRKQAVDTPNINLADRILSPSDFGFHNVLIGTGDQLTFLDFEYAGWDSPVKLVCDFFCQPRIPVSMIFWDTFTEAVTTFMQQPTEAKQIFRQMLPVYQLKWCAIMLNDFLPAGASRRAFSAGDEEVMERLARQYQQTRQAYERIGSYA